MADINKIRRYYKENDDEFLFANNIVSGVLSQISQPFDKNDRPDNDKGENENDYADFTLEAFVKSDLEAFRSLESLNKNESLREEVIKTITHFASQRKFESYLKIPSADTHRGILLGNASISEPTSFAPPPGNTFQKFPRKRKALIYRSLSDSFLNGCRGVGLRSRCNIAARLDKMRVFESDGKEHVESFNRYMENSCSERIAQIESVLSQAKEYVRYLVQNNYRPNSELNSKSRDSSAQETLGGGGTKPLMEMIRPDLIQALVHCMDRLGEEWWQYKRESTEVAGIAYKKGFEEVNARSKMLENIIVFQEELIKDLKDERENLEFHIEEKENEWSLLSSRLYNEIASLKKEETKLLAEQTFLASDQNIKRASWTILQPLLNTKYIVDKALTLVSEKQMKINEMKLLMYRQQQFIRTLQETLSSLQFPMIDRIKEKGKNKLRDRNHNISNQLKMNRMKCHLSDILYVDHGSYVPYKASHPDVATVETFNFVGCGVNSFSDLFSEHDSDWVPNYLADSSENYSPDEAEDLLMTLQINGPANENFILDN